jgi:hypothetical protein
LITGVGGPTPRSFARAILNGAETGDLTLFGTDIHSLAVGLYQTELFEKSFLVPKSGQPGYWPAMEKIIAREKIDLAVIQPEQEVLAWSIRQDKGTLPCPALIPPFKVVEKLLDKSIVHDVLKDYQLVPRSLEVTSQDESFLKDIGTRLGYPFWIRSATGSSGFGSFKVTDFEALINWLKINRRVTRFLASEFLPGRNLACKLLYFEGELVRSACAERVNYIMAGTSPSGITGNTSFGRLINDEHVSFIAREAMKEIFQATGEKPHGFFTVDLKEDANGKPLITEINVRHVAFTSAFAAGGANLCTDTIRLLQNDETFDRTYRQYQFEDQLIFLRDVDCLPIVMKESDLMKSENVLSGN